MTISVSVERYISVVYPLLSLRLYSTHSYLCLALPSVAFSVIFTLPNYFLLSSEALLIIMPKCFPNLSIQTYSLASRRISRYFDAISQRCSAEAAGAGRAGGAGGGPAQLAGGELQPADGAARLRLGGVAPQRGLRNCKCCTNYL